jgi:N utilization substance protein A
LTRGEKTGKLFDPTRLAAPQQDSYIFVSMNTELIAMLDYLEREKGIQRETLVEAISSALVAASKKSFSGGTRELRIDIDPKTGKIRALARLFVVEEVSNPHDEIALVKARQSHPGAQPGDELEFEVTPKDFGRIAAQTARQAITQRIRQIEKDMIYDEFKDRAGEIVTGTVRRFERSDVILDLGKFEGTMPARERVNTEEYSVGDRLRAYVVAVDNAARGPEIILSRSHPNFVRRLFELEVSEINDRTVEIRGIAREAGFRTKVAVFCPDDKVDPVGACVGMRGARVKNIVRELNNEKVDIIRWHEDPVEFVKEALKPSRITNIQLDPDRKTIHINIHKEDLSQAIGKRGQNARLTARLLGWEIDIQEDKSKQEAVEEKTGLAAQSLAESLGVSDEEAATMASQGMTTAEVIVEAGPSYIAAVLGCDEARAEQIFQAAQRSTGAAEPVA